LRRRLGLASTEHHTRELSLGCELTVPCGGRPPGDSAVCVPWYQHKAGFNVRMIVAVCQGWFRPGNGFTSAGVITSGRRGNNGVLEEAGAT